MMELNEEENDNPALLANLAVKHQFMLSLQLLYLVRILTTLTHLKSYSLSRSKRFVQGG